MSIPRDATLYYAGGPAVSIKDGGTGARNAVDARRNLGITASGGGVTDHGALTGLGDDDHPQYFLLAGRAGGQTGIGGTAGADILTLRGNSTTSPLGIRILTADTPTGNAIEFKALSAGSAHVTWAQNGSLAITDASAYVGSTPIKFDANVSSVSGNENNPGIRLRRNTTVSAYVRWGGLFSSFSDNLGIQEPAGSTSGASFGNRVVGGNTVGPIFGISAGAAAKGFSLRIDSITGGATRDWTIGDYSLTWPVADAAGVLTSNGAGTLSWGAATVVDSARTWSTLQKFKDNAFQIVDDADVTKTLVFSLGGATAGADLTLAWSGTADRTITLPDGTGTVGLLSGVVSQEWTDLNIFATLNVGTASIYAQFDPVALTTPRSFAFLDQSGNLAMTTNTTFGVGTILGTTSVGRTNTSSAGFSLADNTTTTKRLRFVLSGAVGNSFFTISNTAARGYTFGNYSGFVAVPVDEGTAGQQLQSAGVGAQPIWAASGAPTMGTATIDFGASPATEASIAVTGQTGIVSGSHVDAFFMSETANEEMAANLVTLRIGTIVAGTGFTIYAESSMAWATGTFTVHWRWQ